MKKHLTTKPKHINDRAALSDEEFQAYARERLARFGDRAGQHGSLAETTVLIPVRVSRDAALRGQLLARRLGLKRARWAAQLVEVASHCHDADWFRAVAAFQNAMKTRAPSELAAG